MREHIDVLIVGAGISGIGAGHWIQKKCPDRSFAILEGRARLGGTWDLFRYPGIRSDSDMFTLGYRFRPWTDKQGIASGGAILRYLEDTAREYGLDEKIRYHHHVVAAAWSTDEARWTVTVKRKDSGETFELTTNFLFLCAGYYDYEQGHTPAFADADRFEGRIVHPQKWTDDIDYAGKRVVVIGSGATAVTLVPAMTEQAAHVTMLQRSPTYIFSRPASSPVVDAFYRHFPERQAAKLTRWYSILYGQFFYTLARKRPEKVKRFLIGEVKRALGADYDVKKHFTPKYDPWDQRLCMVPEGDLFRAIKAGKASVVTDQIDRFTPTGIRLASGEELEADLVVTATGLTLKLLGGLELEVDGQIVNPADHLAYKAMMLSDVPNMAMSFGYTMASWTLKTDLTCEYVCRLLNHMTKSGHRVCAPRVTDPEVEAIPFLDFSAGYVQRALDRLPKQGSKRPWRLYMNFLLDLPAIRLSPVDDGAMQFR